MKHTTWLYQTTSHLNLQVAYLKYCCIERFILHLGGLIQNNTDVKKSNIYTVYSYISQNVKRLVSHTAQRHEYVRASLFPLT